jgi:hypothetical protein
MQENKLDIEEFDNSINYFYRIINCNISKYSPHKMGATFIGIKTNISGILKLHIYILLFPFIKNGGNVPYCNNLSGIYFKDISFNVDENFYNWIYEEMKKQNSIIIMSLESNILKVINGYGDAIISIDKNCKEKKEWMELNYEDWCENNTFNNIFTIKIINPYLYLVPFPVNPIIVQTVKRLNNYIEIVK